MSNLLAATKSLIHVIWNQPEEFDENGISEYVETIRANADETDPIQSPDLISFIYVFAFVFFGLVPENVTEMRKGEIHAVMGELAAVVPGPNATPWLDFHGKCTQQAYFAFHWAQLEDQNLTPKLRALIY